jgi:hypothetical protein
MINGKFEDAQRTEPKRNNSPSIWQVFGNQAPIERSDRLRHCTSQALSMLFCV